jgi:asparagine synthase (glutamine-hydrolysing)
VCGIVARIGLHGRDTRSLDVGILHHRGPDGGGLRYFDLGWGEVALGMTRLKIVDQSEIQVPFHFEHLKVALAYNGEVYNWKALRAEIGGEWETSCDAEVVAAAYRRWGDSFLEHLNGMWGMVLVDLAENRVIIARDRAGEKPVYVKHEAGVLYVASEIKALPNLAPAVNEIADCLEFDCTEETSFQGVAAVGPGKMVIVESRDARERTWWTLPPAEEGDVKPEDLADLLRDAIQIRAVSEVPLAVMLSGGLDSSIIQAVVKSEKLYNVTFPEIDNATDALAASQGQPVTSVTFGLADLERVLPKVVYHLDSPATWTAVCQWFLFERMAKDGIKVVMSGEGADELFGGYSRYRFLHHIDRMMGDPQLLAYAPMREYLFGPDGDVVAKMLNRGEGTLDVARSLVGYYGEGRTLVDIASRTDFYTTMQCLLRMADRMAAAFSIENRSPFFDYRLMELAQRCSGKVTSTESKAPLRVAARILGVPASIVDAKTKRGLAVPWAAWSGGGGARGAWDRKGFAAMMEKAWREVFFGDHKFVSSGSTPPTRNPSQA